MDIGAVLNDDQTSYFIISRQENLSGLLSKKVQYNITTN